MDLDINEVYTLTTLTSGNMGHYDAPPPVTPFPVPYSEDFQSKKSSILNVFHLIIVSHMHNYERSMSDMAFTHLPSDKSRFILIDEDFKLFLLNYCPQVYSGWSLTDRLHRLSRSLQSCPTGGSV